MMTPLRSLADHATALRNGAASCRARTQACLDAAIDPAGEGPRTFVQLNRAAALEAADAFDRRRQAQASLPPLAGMPISVKDLFDIAGDTTRAGSTVFEDAPAAQADAPAIARLRAAGAILVGRTNMTEFAFSGLGLNPHYGTPRNPYDRARGRIPGGSSSGAAISVADGMAVAAIGTDTGGSVRIPAALCGLTGFKPTAKRVPLEGVLPLSPSLDSVGPIAATVACCARLDAVLSGGEARPLTPANQSELRLGVLQGYVQDALEPHVAACFQAALTALSRAGAKLVDVDFDALPRIAECGRQGGIAAAEAYAWHRDLLEKHGAQYDPRVRARIERGREVLENAYEELIRIRRLVMAEAETGLASVDAVLLPATPRTAPLIAELEADDAAYFDANAAMLRNTSVFNFLDGCSLTIPCHRAGEPPVGLMVSALHGRDAQLLQAGLAIEAVLARAGCAIHGRSGSTPS